MSRIAPNYEAWRISEGGYPAGTDPRERLVFLLRYAILAPSPHNTQPWRFKIERANTILLEPDLDRALPHSDPTRRGMTISLGCVLTNLLLAAKHFGWGVRYSFEDQSFEGLRVRCELSEGEGYQETEGEAALFSAIPNRYSHKLEFRRRQLPDDMREKLALSGCGSAGVALLSTEKEIRQVAQAHEQTTLEFAQNPAFAREVSGWMRRNGTSAGDGMPGFTFGLTRTGAVIVKGLTGMTPTVVKVVAKKDYKILSGSEAVCLVSSSEDTLAGQIEAGMTYQYAALTAAAEGVGLSPKSAMVEGGKADRLRELFGVDGVPQIYFGVGYGDSHERHTPRRPLEAILKKEGVL